MKKTLLITGMTAGVMLVASTPMAFASAELELISGVTTETGSIVSPGVYSYVGGVGSWSLDVTTAVGAPASGTFTAPNIDVDTATALGGSAPLEIIFSQTGYSPTIPGNFLASLAGIGTGIGSITFNAYYSSSDVLGAETTLLTSIDQTSGFAAPGFLSGAFGDLGSGTSPGSFTLDITITPNGANPTLNTLDADLTSVPDGATTMVLLGGAFSAIAVFRRKLGAK
jgi:hypothetical protein